ncbi:MAG: hypothetical protein LQ339_003028 [Xanthoria mediterranea]|nr:MAG: hypothetical protein LQ339_003028 [Xanthoria mediterranea]
MGNLCSRSSNKPDNFSTPGRVVGSSSSSSAPAAPTQTPRAQIPKGHGQGRTLGSTTTAAAGRENEARDAAARAAEERAHSAKTTATKGKLGRELEKQRGQKRTETLEGMSAEERRRREVEGVEERRRWD